MTDARAPRALMSIEPPRMFRSADLDWPHEVQVALPASYGTSPDTRYPTLWVTDGAAYLPLVVGLLNSLVPGRLAPELIVVAVGPPGDCDLMTFGMRRGVDFSPPGGAYFYDSFAGRKLAATVGEGFKMDQKGDAFLSLLVDQIRPDLAEAYRMDGDHGLFGHSGGGMFANYALFARRGAFRRFIIGSPSSNGSERAAFVLEESYAARETDLAADVFLGAGEKEITQPLMAMWGIVSAPVLMAETLALRAYPSLGLSARIFPGKDHLTVIPDVLLEGIQFCWRKEIAQLAGPGVQPG